jgi:predicted MFS family arabinose efflux permease
LGGALLALDIWGLEWRPIFLINVPLALATIVAAAFVLPKEQPPAQVTLDCGGVALIVPTCFCSLCRCWKAANSGGRRG